MFRLSVAFLNEENINWDCHSKALHILMEMVPRHNQTIKITVTVSVLRMDQDTISTSALS